MNSRLAVIKRRRSSAAGAPIITPQEVAVINAIALHGTVERAARAMGLARSTVDTHVDRLRNATGLRHRAQLIAWAAVKGYLAVTAEELDAQRQEKP